MSRQAKAVAVPRMVEGIDVGMRMVFALARQGTPLALGELSRAAAAPPSKTHRYLVSLCKTGMLEQDPRSGSYDLGPSAIAFGLAAQRRLPEFRYTSMALTRLHERTGATASAVTWGSWGPVVTLRKNTTLAVTLNTRVGSILPVTTSSSGQLFAAMLSKEIIQPFIEREFAQGLQPKLKGKPISKPDMQKLLAKIRRTRLSHIHEDLVAGVDAVAAPICDAAGRMVMALALVVPHNTRDLSVGSDACNALVEEASAVSQQLAKA
jgi:DNA-binding IclR family transcriptional regulator